MKSAVDTLIHNARIYTMNGDQDVYEDGALAVLGSRIAAIGASADMKANYRASRTIDARSAIMLPGLIDTHLHAALPTRALLAPAKNGQPFRYSAPSELVSDRPPSALGRAAMTERGENILPFFASLGEFRQMSDSIAYLVAMYSHWLAIRSGVTCYVEGGGGSADSLGYAAMQTGIRAGIGHAAWDICPVLSGGQLSTEKTSDTDDELAKTEASIRRWHGRAEGRLTVWCLPIADVTSSRALLRGMSEISRKHDLGVSCHAAAAFAQDALSKAAHGQSGIERLEDNGLLNDRLLAVHFGSMSDAELYRVLAAGTRASHCIGTSNLEGKGFVEAGRLWDLMKAGNPVGLGTDTNFYGDLLGQARSMQQQYRELSGDSRRVTDYFAIRTLTVTGAACAGLGKDIGVLEQGRKADLILVNTERPEYFGTEPLSAFLRFGASADVASVMIDGKLVMENRRMTMFDEDELLREIHGAAAVLAS